ncbi:MAG: restriction endonuclease subunit S [Spirochaetales bacterium]|nr:restriction endonuclease subunit S [Spirochaetales bacterium]
MKEKLKNIATVQVGYSFRSRLEASYSGDVAVIQMKDLLQDNTVNCGGLMKIDMEAVKVHHLVQKGDLVFRSRGQVTTASVILEDPGKAVVAAPLLRIRVTRPEKVLPEYLNWYISQRDAQAFFTSKADGTVQKMISKLTIEDLEVVLPSLEQQKNIVELASLSSREQKILKTLAEKRQQYIEIILMQIAKGWPEASFLLAHATRGIEHG